MRNDPLADRAGKSVTIVEMLDGLLQVGPSMCHANKEMLLDLLKFNEVKTLKNASLLEVTNEGAVVTDESSNERTLLADNVVLAIGLDPNRDLYNSLKNKVPDLYLIGDAREPRLVKDAIWEAYEIADNI